eukprot:scaffold161594_cov16-Tisochrysis_lutea.AAC.1
MARPANMGQARGAGMGVWLGKLVWISLERHEDLVLGKRESNFLHNQLKTHWFGDGSPAGLNEPRNLSLDDALEYINEDEMVEVGAGLWVPGAAPTF